jgi:tryptophan synthase alpha chain
MEQFLKSCRSSGISGVMVVDLPLEEAQTFVRKARRSKIDTIFFITPTTRKQRIKKILRLTRGFIYYISVTGITGPKELVLQPLLVHLKELKKQTHCPVCVGFGIHTKAQAEKILKQSDGVIVGSAIVEFIHKHYKEKNFLDKLSSFIKKFYV